MIYIRLPITTTENDHLEIGIGDEYAGTVVVRSDVILGTKKIDDDTVEVHAGPRTIKAQMSEEVLLDRLQASPIDLTQYANEHWHELLSEE